MQRQCIVCGRPFEARRPHAKYCDSTYNNRAQRRAPRLWQVTAPITPTDGEDLVAAVIAELEAAGQRSRRLACRRLVMARAVEAAETGAAFAALPLVTTWRYGRSARAQIISAI